jgi:hypothetical protein
MTSVPSEVPSDPAGHGTGNSTAQSAGTGASTPGAAQLWASPGVSIQKRWLTGGGVALAAALFIFIAVHEGASMWVSTLIGIVFIGCFIWYLRIVAPTPFTLALDQQGLTRTERDAEPMGIPWASMARVKEEVFKNGVPISLAVYKRVGERGVHRVFVVYRDDVPRFDELLAALRAALPETVPWQREVVHE